MLRFVKIRPRHPYTLAYRQIDTDPKTLIQMGTHAAKGHLANNLKKEASIHVSSVYRRKLLSPIRGCKSTQAPMYIQINIYEYVDADTLR